MEDELLEGFIYILGEVIYVISSGGITVNKTDN